MKYPWIEATSEHYDIVKLRKSQLLKGATKRPRGFDSMFCRDAKRQGILRAWGLVD